MPSRQVVNRLQLGPIVGHTDENSSRIWIQVFDDPEIYHLRVQGIGLFPFISTEISTQPLEFRTAIAIAEGLRPDWRYRYNILRNGRSIPGTNGTFRTMPNNGSWQTFYSVQFHATKLNPKVLGRLSPSL